MLLREKVPRTAVVLVGASVRAAAYSAVRAGFAPWCADLFADADLVRMAPCQRVRPFPEGLLVALGDAPRAAPIIYTGALENRPDLVEQFCERGPVWGNSPEVLRQVRAPENFFQLCRRHGLPCPRLAEDTHAGPTSGRWLIKPRHSAGGRGIRFFRPGMRVHHGCFLQEWIDGVACAAIYVGQPGRTCLLLGVTRQLVAESWLKARSFQYCGSMGPWPLTVAQQTSVQRLGDMLTSEVGLKGVFGVDGVLRGEEFLPVEVNPRYSASVEVLEHALGWNILALHARSFGADTAALRAPESTGPGKLVGKAIVFAPQAFRFPETGPWRATLEGNLDPWALPDFADIPGAGKEIHAGQPILTVFATGATPEEVLAELKRRVQRIGLPGDGSLSGLE